METKLTGFVERVEANITTVAAPVPTGLYAHLFCQNPKSTKHRALIVVEIDVSSLEVGPDGIKDFEIKVGQAVNEIIMDVPKASSCGVNIRLEELKRANERLAEKLKTAEENRQQLINTNVGLVAERDKLQEVVDNAASGIMGLHQNSTRGKESRKRFAERRRGF